MDLWIRGDIYVEDDVLVIKLPLKNLEDPELEKLLQPVLEYIVQQLQRIIEEERQKIREIEKIEAVLRIAGLI